MLLDPTVKVRLSVISYPKDMSVIILDPNSGWKLGPPLLVVSGLNTEPKKEFRTNNFHLSD